MNEGTIQKILRSVGQTCAASRNKYVAIQEDLPEGWSFTTALGMLGLGGAAAKPTTPAIDPEIAKEMFAKL